MKRIDCQARHYDVFENDGEWLLRWKDDTDDFGGIIFDAESGCVVFEPEDEARFMLNYSELAELAGLIRLFEKHA